MGGESSARRLAQLADEIGADSTFAPEDEERVLSAAEAERSRITAERAIAETAHLHRTKHVAADAVCHDCGRGLISDRGTERILVCPRVHGNRPADLEPAGDAAVECGVKNDG